MSRTWIYLIIPIVILIFILFPNIDSIWSNGSVIGVEGVEDSDTYESRLENPIITGRIGQADLDFGNTPEGPFSCCDSYRLRADGDYFLLPTNETVDTVFVALQEREASDPEGSVRFQSPPLWLPTDGTPVNLQLLDPNGEVTTEASVRLADDVIVLPVHVHVLRSSERELWGNLIKERVFYWFADPAFDVYTSLRPGSGDGNRTIKQIVPEVFRMQTNVDRIFYDAGIQFKFITHEVIVDDEIERRIHNCGVRGWPVEDLHSERYYPQGIHIYVGRYLDEEFPSSDCQHLGQTYLGNMLTCAIEPDWNRISIALAWNEIERGRHRSTLAHEIGHYLGLAHSTDPTTCGSQALAEGESVGGNLMNPTVGGTRIDPEQIEIMRRSACAYLEHWNHVPRGGC